MNRIFISALSKGMDQLVIQIMDKGFPRDLNAPSFELVLEAANQARIMCPSYFLLAISFGSLDVISAMMKVSFLFYFILFYYNLLLLFFLSSSPSFFFKYFLKKKKMNILDQKIERSKFNTNME